MKFWRLRCEKHASVGIVTRRRCASNVETMSATSGAVVETAGDAAWNAAVVPKLRSVTSTMTRFALIAEITSHNQRSAT